MCKKMGRTGKKRSVQDLLTKRFSKLYKFGRHQEQQILSAALATGKAFMQDTQGAIEEIF